MAKRNTKKEMKGESCEHHGCCCRGTMIRIGTMGFILFLMTVWPAAGNALFSVPWWIYLIIWLVFCGLAMGMRNKCWCCKKK